KSLKVTDLKDILAKASAPAPAKINKQDLINRILANPTAVQVYKQLYPTPQPKNTPPATPPINPSSNDDLLAPPEEFVYELHYLAYSHFVYSLDLDEFNALPPVSSPKSSSLEQYPSQPQIPASPFKVTTLVAPATIPSTAALVADKQTGVDEDLEKHKARAARFGIPFVEPMKPYKPRQKKSAPADKTTLLAEVCPILSCEPERLQARTARFGPRDASSQPPKKGAKRAAPAEVDPEELERRGKRAERFGLSNGVSQFVLCSTVIDKAPGQAVKA
ncbi:hypothetical protein BS17DRAFT_695683, partial [Gyrodon lividus]